MNKKEIKPTKIDIVLISIIFAVTLFAVFFAIVIFVDAMK